MRGEKWGINSKNKNKTWASLMHLSGKGYKPEHQNRCVYDLIQCEGFLESSEINKKSTPILFCSFIFLPLKLPSKTRHSYYFCDTYGSVVWRCLFMSLSQIRIGAHIDVSVALLFTFFFCTYAARKLNISKICFALCSKSSQSNEWRHCFKRSLYWWDKGNQSNTQK